jgi:hypothetical protein
MTNFLFTGAKKEAKIENMITPFDVKDGPHMETKPSTNDKDCCGKPYVEGK